MAGNMSLYTATLSTYEFPFNPTKPVDALRKERTIFVAETATSAQFDDKGFRVDAYGLIGKEIPLEWEIMSWAFWDKLYDFYLSSEDITFDPKERARTNGETYRVVFESFTNDGMNRIHDYVEKVRAVLKVRAIA